MKQHLLNIFIYLISFGLYLVVINVNPTIDLNRYNVYQQLGLGCVFAPYAVAGAYIVIALMQGTNVTQAGRYVLTGLFVAVLGVVNTIIVMTFLTLVTSDIVVLLIPVDYLIFIMLSYYADLVMRRSRP